MITVIRKICVLVVFLGVLALQGQAGAMNITSPFGWRVHPLSGEWQYHTGIDIAEDFGAAIPALLPGEIVFAGEYAGYGNMVLVRHAGNVFTLYAHCSGLWVVPGQQVAAGEVIATVGSTGNSTGPHLHLELWVDGQYADPGVLFSR